MLQHILQQYTETSFILSTAKEMLWKATNKTKQLYQKQAMHAIKLLVNNILSIPPITELCLKAQGTIVKSEMSNE